MACYAKAAIRLDKIHTRNQKPHYKHLTPQQKALVKAMEAVKQCERDIWHMDKGGGPNWRRTKEGGQLLEVYSKANDKYMKIAEKLDLTEAQENELYNSCHNSRFYGGSF